MKTKIKSDKSKGFLLIISFFGAVTYGQVDSSEVPFRIDESLLGRKLECNLNPVVFPPTDTSSTSLTVSLEYRPRLELHNGFRQLRSDTTAAAIFTSHRARLNFDIKKKRFAAALSMQDIRTFGAADPRSNAGTVQVFEAWAEPFFNEHLSLRIGKQKFMLDNSRLFAQNDWRNNGGTHDAAKLIYSKGRVASQLLFAWNQSAEGNYFTNFSPVGFNNYKSLLVGYLQLKSKNEKLIFSTTNYYEGFQYGKNGAHQNFRYTNGGRLKFQDKKLEAVAMGFIQWGHNNVGKRLSAFYYHAEGSYVLKYFKVLLGAEFKSGNSAKADVYDRAFQYPYGVAHAFNGTMEYFANGFAGSSVDFGLFDPYLELSKIVKSKLKIALRNHLFYSQYLAYNKTYAPSKYLGVESDLNLTYYPNGYAKIDLGISAMKASKSMEFINAGSANYLSYWTYLQATFTPQLFSSKK